MNTAPSSFNFHPPFPILPLPFLFYLLSLYYYYFRLRRLALCLCLEGGEAGWGQVASENFVGIATQPHCFSVLLLCVRALSFACRGFWPWNFTQLLSCELNIRPGRPRTMAQARWPSHRLVEARPRPVDVARPHHRDVSTWSSHRKQTIQDN